MHFLTFYKSDGVIIDSRVDTSVPHVWEAEALCATVARDRNIPIEQLETQAFETLPPSDGSFDIPQGGLVFSSGKRLYDQAAGVIRKNPNYVEPPPAPKQYNTALIRSHLSLAEKLKWDESITPSIRLVKSELSQPTTDLAAFTELLQFLVDAGDLSTTSMAKMLAA